jgi:DNA-binding CsgD family transcriptional regulator
MEHPMSGPEGERATVDLAALSEREREVLELARTGLSARAIAERLTLTEATIRSHLSRIYGKLGVGGRVELLVRLNGHLPDPADTSTRAADAAPPRRHRGRWVAAFALLLAIVGGALFLWLRPDLPPATSLASVSQLVAQGRATNLDLRGDTLFVTSADGQRYRVGGVDEASMQELVAEARTSIGTSFEVSMSDGDTLVSVLIFLSATLPLAVVLLAGAVAAMWWRRRPPQPRPT